jgi:hypothetical protein
VSANDRKQRSARLKESEDCCGKAIAYDQAGDPRRIAPGWYEALVDGYQVRKPFPRRSVVVVWFTIIEPGPAFGVHVARWYNALSIRKRGFKVAHASDLYRDHMQITRPGKPPRLDRIPISQWKNLELLVKLEPVRKDHSQREIPAQMQELRVRQVRLLEESNQLKSVHPETGREPDGP